MNISNWGRQAAHLRILFTRMDLEVWDQMIHEEVSFPVWDELRELGDE